MFNHRKAICFLAVVVIACVPMALAQGTYTQIDYPGAVSTYAIGVDTAGEIVGSYYDTNSVGHGFLFSSGTYTTIDFPGSFYTETDAINDVGQIVGTFLNSGGTSADGFIYDVATQSFTTLVFPNSSGLNATGINNAGTIVGLVFFNQSDKPTNVGFELAGGRYHKVQPQGFAYSYVRGISNLGVAVGGGSRDNNLTNFLLAQGNFHQLKIPVPNPAPQGINAAGTIVGQADGTGGSLEGFLYQGGVIQRLVFPGSTFTAPTGISDPGLVVGFFIDSSSTHGFTWTPPADAAKK